MMATTLPRLYKAELICTYVCTPEIRIRIYCSWRIYIAAGGYILQLEDIYCSWRIYIAAGGYILQLEDIYCSWRIHIAAGGYILQLEDTYCSWRIHITAGEHILQLEDTYCSWRTMHLSGNMMAKTLPVCAKQNSYVHTYVDCKS